MKFTKRNIMTFAAVGVLSTSIGLMTLQTASAQGGPSRWYVVSQPTGHSCDATGLCTIDQCDQYYTLCPRAIECTRADANAKVEYFRDQGHLGAHAVPAAAFSKQVDAGLIGGLALAAICDLG